MSSYFGFHPYLYYPYNSAYFYAPAGQYGPLGRQNGFGVPSSYYYPYGLGGHGHYGGYGGTGVNHSHYTLRGYLAPGHTSHNN